MFSVLPIYTELQVINGDSLLQIVGKWAKFGVEEVNSILTYFHLTEGRTKKKEAQWLVSGLLIHKAQ